MGRDSHDKRYDEQAADFLGDDAKFDGDVDDELCEVCGYPLEECDCPFPLEDDDDTGGDDTDDDNTEDDDDAA